MPTETLRRDLRIGLRVLIKEKGFCALAVIVLALGIAGVTTMFSVVNGVMLRGFSFPNADRLVSLNFIDPTSATFFGVNGQVSSKDYEELRPQQQSFEKLAAYLNGSTVNITVDGHPQRYTGAYVTEEFLRDPRRRRRRWGAISRRRTTSPAPRRWRSSATRFWQRDFGGASDIVGKGVRMNGKAGHHHRRDAERASRSRPTRSSGFRSSASSRRASATTRRRTTRRCSALLKPGVSLDQANAEATTIARRFAAAYPDTNKQFNTGQVQPLLETFTPRPLRGTLWTMLGFCVGVLLISCVNVMNMQFARATLRAKELAVRSSLGATRIRLIRQMLTESLLVAAIGAAAGDRRWPTRRPTGCRPRCGTSRIRRRRGSPSTSTARRCSSPCSPRSRRPCSRACCRR